MFCSNCGKEIDDKACICVGCGASVKKGQVQNGHASAGWWWLGFLVPLAGLIIFIVCNDSAPAKAKKAGIGALVGVILSIVLYVLIYVGFVALTFYGLSDFADYAYYM